VCRSKSGEFDLQTVLEGFFEFFDLWPDDEIAVGLGTVVVVIVLMVVFGGIEHGELGDLGDDGIVVGFVLIHLCLIVFSFLFLFFRMIEDGAAILGADVVTLAVEGRRVVGLEEDVQQVMIAGS
jgi:hypothetical protein